MANKVKGLGTILQVKIATVYTTIGQRVEISGPKMAVGVANVSDLDSTVEEKRATLPDSGEVSFQIFFDPADTTHTQLTTWMGAPPTTAPEWKISFSTSPVKTAAFSGVLKSFDVGGMTKDGFLTADCTIDITGAITWA